MTYILMKIAALGLLMLTETAVYKWGKKLYEKRFQKSIDFSGCELTAMLAAPMIQSVVLLLYGYKTYEVLELGTVGIFVMLLGAIDRREKIIPNRVLSVMLCTKLAFVLGCFAFDREYALSGLYYGMIGICTISVLFLLVRAVCKGSVGMGDIKLMIALAFCFGIQRILFILLVAAFIAMVSMLVKIAGRRIGKNEGISFAPFVAGATWTVLVAGM